MKSSSRFFVALVVVALLFFTASRTAAQEVDSAIVVGTVLDSSQAAVPGAAVTLTHLATNAATVVHTDERGEYRTPPLRPGEYQISVGAGGFKQFEERGIVLSIGDVRQVNAALEVGEVTESVTVSANADLLQTEDATVGSLISNQQITELPLNGRNYMQLAVLSAGTVPTTTAGIGISIGGQPGAQVAFLLDGQDNNNQEIGLNASQKDIIEPSVDAIQEFKVITNGYSAEYGRSSSGVISAAIKSGTNQFHGAAFEFFRNAALDAKNYFTAPDTGKPEFGRNQFGGDLGGPIIHNKTFFFADAEVAKIRESYTVVNTIPTVAQDNGEFTTPIKDPSTGLPFPVVNGLYTIPADRIDPIAKQIGAFLPAPQTSATTSNYVYASPENEDTHRWDLRFDQILNDKQNLFFRYSSDVENFGVTSFLPPLPGIGFYSSGPQVGSIKTGAQDVDGKSFVLGYNYVLSPTLVASIRAGWNYLNWHAYIPDQPLQGIGIPGVDESTPGMSQILITGLPALGNTIRPNLDQSQNRQLSGDLTWSKGPHTIKFGVQAYWLQTYFLSAQQANGTFNFNGQYTGNPFADFLLGDVSSATLSTYSKLDFRTPETQFFVQDDWKVTRHLTFNLGLRYELTLPTYDRDNQIANFEMNTDPYVGTPHLVLAGTNGDGVASRALQDVNYHQFAPRLGFAYSLGDKTVVRGGYGIFYSNVITEGGSSSLERNPPFSVVTQVSPSKTNPTFQLQNGFPAGSLSLANASNVQLISFDQRSVPPTDYQWNLNVQRELPKGLLLEVGYNGNNFDHNWWSIDGNPAPPGPGAINPRRIFTSTTIPGTSDTVSLANVVRIQKDGYSRYNGLDVKIEKRYEKGISFTASYVYSKTMALGDAQGLQNPADWAAEYAVAGQDLTHHFVASAMYELPFGKAKRFGSHWTGVTDTLLGGWAVDPILTINSGFPVNLTVVGEPANTGQNDRPNVVGDWHLANPTPQEWFNTAAFVANAPYTYGNAGRNLLRGPGLFNLDLAAHKSLRFTERLNAQIRVESFNFTNTPAFNAPDAAVGDPNFGRIQTAGNPRQIQLGFKLLF